MLGFWLTLLRDDAKTRENLPEECYDRFRTIRGSPFLAANTDAHVYGKAWVARRNMERLEEEDLLYAERYVQWWNNTWGLSEKRSDSESSGLDYEDGFSSCSSCATDASSSTAQM